MAHGERTREVAEGIYRIDVNHPEPLHTCAYLIVADDTAAIIDCGGGRRGAAAVMGGLAELNLAAEQVRWLLVTHAHLDHAGAAGLLMQTLPQATFAAHPSALKHLCNPQQALAPASVALFGEAFFETYYGGLLAVDAARAQPLMDGEELALGTRTLTTHYTPGHAWHHASFYDAAASFIVAGDAYGNSYRQTDGEDGFGLLMPVMPPTQFDPPAMVDSIHRLHGLQARAVGLAHFDVIDTAAHGDAYRDAQLQALDNWLTAAADIYAKHAEDFEPHMKDYLFEWVGQHAAAHGMEATAMRQLYNNDISLSAAGFAHYMKKTAAA